jgi:hypothetical protein
MKKLAQPTGSIERKEDGASDTDSQIVRSAILVHAGPNGEKVEFHSGDGPISFDADRIKQVVEVHNQRLERLAKDYGGVENIPMGAYEPILDSHANDSNDRIIGRLTGTLKFEVRKVPKVGENVPCAVAEGVTFLGKDTVDRVKDGRIYHLSIGINEKDNSLGEISTVVQPAATGAMLLKKKQITDHGGSQMNAEVKRMQAHSERLNKLSQVKEGIATLLKKTDSTQSIIKLNSNKFRITHKLRSLSQSGRIGRAEYKDLLENKLNKLAALGDSELNIALSLLDAVKPDSSRIRMASQYGSPSASDVMEFGKALAQQKDKEQYKRLRKEISGDWKKLTGKELVADEDHEEHSHEMRKHHLSGPFEKEIHPGKDPHAVEGEAGDEAQLSHHMAKLAHHLESGDMEGAMEAHKHLSHHLAKHLGHEHPHHAHLAAIHHHLSSGDFESAKEAHATLAHHLKLGSKHMSEFAGDVKSEDQHAKDTEVQGQLDELKTQLARLAGMVSNLIGTEEEEGKHFGEISKEHEEVAQE